MRKVFLTTVMALAALQVASAAEATFESPDKHIVVTISDNGGKPTYQVTLDGVTFIEQSPLGLKANFADLTQGLSLTASNSNKVSDHYTLKTIKQTVVDYEATEGVCQFAKADGRTKLDIIFRISNRDVAYRYKVYDRGQTKVAVIESEASSFVFEEAEGNGREWKGS